MKRLLLGVGKAVEFQGAICVRRVGLGAGYGGFQRVYDLVTSS
jgi:hypothetical protein